jgi:hypothetical protein
MCTVPVQRVPLSRGHSHGGSHIEYFNLVLLILVLLIPVGDFKLTSRGIETCGAY